MNKKILIGTVISVMIVAFVIHFFPSSYSIVKKDEIQQKLDKQSTANEQTPPQSVAESKRTAEPEADTLGKQLLESTNALLQEVGMAVLAENNILTDDNIKQIPASLL